MNDGKRLNKPLIKPEKVAWEVMVDVFGSNYTESADYSIIVAHIETYQKAGDMRSWDTYCQKIPPAVREKLKLMMTECRRNGFVSPHAYNGKLHWRQIVTPGKMQDDLCILCTRSCALQDMLNSGEAKWKAQTIKGWHPPTPCWEDSKN